MNIEGAGPRNNVSGCNTTILEIQKRPSKKNWKEKFVRRYAFFLAKYPFIVLMACFLLFVLAATLTFTVGPTTNPLRDFSKPSKGFDARGTLINRRMISYIKLRLKMLRMHKSFYLPTRCPLEILPYAASKTVYAPIGEHGNLLNAKSLIDICKLEDRLVRREPLFENNCVKGRLKGTRFYNKCCPSLSIGYYVALLNNKTDCQNITDKDVDYLKKLIITSVTNGTAARGRSNTLSEDLQRRIVSNVMHFMVDNNFNSDPRKAKLSYTVAFSSIQRMAKNEFLENLFETKLRRMDRFQERNVRLAAYEFERVTDLVYKKQLITDVWYIVSAIIFIIVFIWIYSGSLFISFMGFGSVIFSIILSYWIYSFVFKLSFFPFMNALTIIFVVGIGADDIFVYVLAWKHARQKYPKSSSEIETIAQWTDCSLRHAAAAMFVTSFTTATAFYAGLSSNITVLRCFSIFTGTTILATYFYMVTWLPAVVILQQRFFEVCICIPPDNKVHVFQENPIYSTPESDDSIICQRIHIFHRILKKCNDAIFKKILPYAVLKLRFGWLLFLLLVAIFGIISLTYHPKLSLPTSHVIRRFSRRQPVESSYQDVRQKLRIDDTLSSKGTFFPITLVWGVHDMDNGKILDPDKTGKILWDSTLDMASNESQVWMLKFCRKAKESKLYNRLWNEESRCFMEDFDNFLKRPCNKSKCCNTNLPIPAEKFKACAIEYYRSTQQKHMIMNEDGSIKALIFKFYSDEHFVFEYGPVDAFWKRVLSWSEEMLKDMPRGLQNGWVISSLHFYDLQTSIANGTIKTVLVTIAIAAVVLLLTIRNILITFYAIITITAIVCVTTGSLVMAGWKLNVIESMTMSICGGLAIDFTLHYGVAYFMCEDSHSKEERVKYALWQVGSAVTMGAVTTFAAGLAMMPAVIYAYIQIGHFLMMIMTVSWFFSTFFFLPLCAVGGPQRNKGNIFCCLKLRNIGNDMNEDSKEEDERSNQTEESTISVSTVDT